MLTGLMPIPPRGAALTPQGARQAAQAFEAQFLAQMLQPIFETTAMKDSTETAQFHHA